MPLVKPIPPDPAAIGQRDRATAISRRLRSRLTLCSTALAIAISLTSPNPLHACACCTDFGQRDVKVIQLDSYRLETIKRLRFSNKAELFTGPMGVEEIKGISVSSELLDLAVSQGRHRWVFEFRDNERHSGTLTLNIPNSVSIFEVDPRQEKPKAEGGQGPRLYKEWKLTGRAVGTGIFSGGVGAGQNITLILQGHGNSCTTADDFTHWTLILYGPKAEYSLFGELGAPISD
jgi:hypothetical protein